MNSYRTTRQMTGGFGTIPVIGFALILPLLLGRAADAQSQTSPSITPIASVDLRVPELAELSTAAATDRVEIPNYARDAFADWPTVIINRGGDRSWQASSFTWQASHLYHHPLYFEDFNLERHGHSFGVVQPAVSAGLAFGQLLALPYQIAAQPPCRCVYTLGQQRPGNCVPYQLQTPPLSLPGAAAEGGALTGLILLIP